MAISNRSVATTLTATDYNELRNKIIEILGPNTGGSTRGYGQATTSSTVAGGSTTLVSATHMAQLRADIVKAWVHITANSFNLTVPSAGSDLIKATASGADYNETHNAYIEAINYCYDNAPFANPSQMTLSSNVATATAGTNWNGTVTTTHRVTWADSSHQRWFFNAGGQIRFSAAHNNNTTAKADNWQQFLSNKVTGITFGYSQYWQYNFTPQRTWFTQYPDGNAAYSDNYHNLSVSRNSNVMDFTMNFVDADRGNTANTYYWIAAYDEDVIGTTTSNISIYYPTGSTTDPLLGSISTVQLDPPTVSVV